LVFISWQGLDTYYMPARSVKTFYKELGHRQHRDHRSKQGRNNPGGKSQIKGTYEFQAKKERIKLNGIKNNITNIKNLHDSRSMRKKINKRISKI